MTRGHWKIQTPHGWFVPGLRGQSAEAVWGRYVDLMPKTRAELEAAGYRAVFLQSRATIQPEPVTQ